MRSFIAILCFSVVGAAVCAQEKPPSAEAEKARIERLVEQLGADNFEERASATKALRSLGKSARTALEQAAKSRNLERRTRAGLLLRELDAPERPPSASGRRLRLEPLRKVRPGEPEVEVRPQERPRRLQELDPFAGDFLARIEELMKRGTPQLGLPGPFGPQGNLRFSWPGRSSRTQIDGDGNRLEFKRGQDGITLRVETTDPVTKKRSANAYRAESVEDFREKHPEVYRKYEGTGIFQEALNSFAFRFPNGRFIRPSVPGLAPGPAPIRPVGPQLGVIIGEVPDALRAHVDLPKRCVMVEQVNPGSAAESLGVRQWDVIATVDGQPVNNADDIRALLRTPGTNGRVSLEVHRKGQRLLLEGARPK